MAHHREQRNFIRRGRGPAALFAPRRLSVALGFLVAIGSSSCATADRAHEILVSVPDQEMVVLRYGKPIAVYPVSTSKFGLGSAPGTYRTPVGRMEVAKKIGTDLPPGAVFKRRHPTGEILPVNAPGRDPIVSRILWLRGLEEGNRNTFERFIYIHGTPEERNIGAPVSYGCIRMKSSDVVALFDTVGVGARVEVMNLPMRAMLSERAAMPFASAPGPAEAEPES